MNQNHPHKAARKNLQGIVLALAALARPFGRTRHAFPVANAFGDEGIHEEAYTRKADAVFGVRHLLAKEGTDDQHFDLCGASDLPVGVCPDEDFAIEDNVTLYMLGATDQTRLMVASEAIDAGSPVYTAASGKVQDEPASAGTYYRVGRARTDASGDGELVEVETHAPVRVVVVAAVTSTDGTAAAASANLAALAAEAEKIGDDVRSLAAALATPAEVKVLTS